MEGIQVSTNRFDGLEGLGCCSTSLKNGIFRCLGWACGAVGDLGCHYRCNLGKLAANKRRPDRETDISELLKHKYKWLELGRIDVILISHEILLTIEVIFTRRQGGLSFLVLSETQFHVQSGHF